MSNDGARTARCSRDGDAIHRAHDFSERRLERSGAFLRVTQKSAWHKGFCAVAILGASAGARARREIFSPRCTRELSQSDDSGLLKIFFTKASRKRARDRIRDRTRANRWSGDSRRAFGAALGGRAARKFSGAMRAVARRTARVWPGVLRARGDRSARRVVSEVLDSETERSDGRRSPGQGRRERLVDCRCGGTVIASQRTVR